MSQAEALWSVEFEIKPLGLQGPEPSSVFHVTSGEDSGVLGTRYPAIFIAENEQKLLIRYDISGKTNQKYKQPTELSENSWTTVNVKQEDRDGTVFFVITINDEVAYQQENTKPRRFPYMKVYSADPWYPQRANVQIRNLRYITSPSTCNYGIRSLF